MTILIDKNTRAIIQGITGVVGSFQAKIMQEYGTNLVAGVTPGKGGRSIHNIPVYDFVSEAVKQHTPNAAFCFVPARFVRDAALEVIESKIELLVITTEGVPEKDMLEILEYSRINGTRVIGPDTPGLISPGVCKLGVHPNRMFLRGKIGVLSKSGALSYEVCKKLTEGGVGQSTVVGIGGGPIWGSHQIDILRLFFEDPGTSAVILLGEVGGSMELETADYLEKNLSKPVISLIVGRSAPPGAQMGHAGAIIEGNEGTAQYKLERLKQAGAIIVSKPQEIPDIIIEMGLVK